MQQPPQPSQPEQQQLITRLTDVSGETLEILGPITGVGSTPRLPVMDAAVATGIADMDAHGFMAGEYGASKVNGRPVRGSSHSEPIPPLSSRSVASHPIPTLSHSLPPHPMPTLPHPTPPRLILPPPPSPGAG